MHDFVSTKNHEAIILAFVFRGGGSQKHRYCRQVVRKGEDLRKTYKLNDKEVYVAFKARVPIQ